MKHLNESWRASPVPHKRGKNKQLQLRKKSRNEKVVTSFYLFLVLVWYIYNSLSFSNQHYNKNIYQNENATTNQNTEWFPFQFTCNLFVEGQHIKTLTSIGGKKTDGCPTEFQEYNNKDFEW